MPPILVMCPITEDLVPTGQHADSEEELEALQGRFTMLACPECGRDHEWASPDAVLAPEGA